MSDDLIERSDAIKALRKLGHEVVVIDKVCPLGVAQEFIDAIRAIPSVDTFEITKEVLIEAIDNAETVGDVVENIIDRPKGKWIIHSNGKMCDCSACNESYDRTFEYVDEWNYCPHCGARMKGIADD